MGKMGCLVNHQGGREVLGRNSRRAEEEFVGGKYISEKSCGLFFFFFLASSDFISSLTTVPKFSGFPV